MSRRSVIAIVAAAAIAAPLAAQDTGSLPLDPLVTRGTLANGITYFIRENRYPEQRAELRLAVKAGSVMEDADQLGLAHFAEHMAFNGTKSFPKNDIIHYLQSIGSRFGADVNAYTSFDETVYMLEVPTDTGKFLETGMQIMSEWAGAVTYNAADIDAERGVVIEEWRAGRGAGARMRDQQLPVLLKGSRYADRLPIGTRESLEGFTHDALKRFYATWYRPDMMAVIAVGDFDKNAVEALIRRHFASIPGGEPTARPSFPIPPHDSVYVTIATDPEATNSSIQLYNLVSPREVRTIDDFRARYIEGLGLDMLNARFAEITQRADPPFAYAGASRGAFVASADAVTLFAGLQPDQMLSGFDAALVELERARRHGFTATELKRTIASEAAGQERMYQERDKIESAPRADELVRHFLHDEDVLGTEGEYRAYQAINPTVTLDEVNAAARTLFTPSSPVIAVNAPAKPGVTVPSAEQLLAVYRAVANRQIEPYRDSVVGSELMPVLPEPGTITAERTIEELGVTEWTLSNGVTVVLKPTDFKNDEVVLSATSPGGTSLYPDSMIVSATFASNVAGLGGLGEFSAVDLRKLLSGKVALANPVIGDRTEGLNGRSNARDVETMLQLVYLRFTAPRRDSSAFVAFRQTMQAALANMAASPQKAFTDTLIATISRNSPRAVSMSAEVLDEIDLDQAMAVYRDRFADAGDFTFFLVGSFSLASIRPLVTRYLGALPSTGRVEAARNVDPPPPTGVIEKVVRKGSEPQSMTVMVFSGPFAWTPEENHVLISMGELLQNRLLDNLREELGGTYSVTAQTQGMRDHPNAYVAFVQFGSAPDRADELEEAVLAEIRAVADSGVTEEELVKVREGQIRGTETAIKTNPFWANTLESYWQYGDDPLRILSWRERVETITAERIQAAAQKYLSGENYIRVTLLPAEVTP